MDPDPVLGDLQSLMMTLLSNSASLTGKVFITVKDLISSFNVKLLTDRQMQVKLGPVLSRGSYQT